MVAVVRLVRLPREIGVDVNVKGAHASQDGQCSMGVKRAGKVEQAPFRWRASYRGETVVIRHVGDST